MDNQSKPNRSTNLATGRVRNSLWSRRSWLQRTAAAGAIAGVGLRDARADVRERPVLVIVELSGGNDGLNTLVPFGDDAYYRHRPTLGIAANELLKVDEHFGFNAGASGLHRLWQTGDLAAIHGCGYEQPSYSHFTSMGYWHTAAPHSGQVHGWVGRLADALAPEAPPNFLINVGATQSLAVAARHHVPVVFDDPARFQREQLAQAGEAARVAAPPTVRARHSTHRFVRDVARSAQASAAAVRGAWENYSSPIDYGIAPLDLPKVAACISAGLPAQLYYVSFRNNAFDTHVQQGPLHQRLLSYAADAIHGFVRDMQRMGLGKRVTLMAFSEFGRRVGENANQGTDHGSANLMFVAGENVRGGHYGELPSLVDLNAEDNLQYTTDFRRVYASVMDGWLRGGVSAAVLGGRYEPFDLFETAPGRAT